MRTGKHAAIEAPSCGTPETALPNEC
jgi:hypothetical protein